MSRTVFGLLSVVGAALTVAAAMPRVALGVFTCLGVAGLVWVCSRCRHTGPLGLLPPITLADGTKQPARWFCSTCGKEWPAGLDHDTAPIVKYSGFDESKARTAAKRALELERRTQELAVRRAGLAVSRVGPQQSTPTPASSAPASTPGGVPTVVSIQDRRAAVK
jgi:hypothetical protein